MEGETPQPRVPGWILIVGSATALGVALLVIPALGSEEIPPPRPPQPGAQAPASEPGRPAEPALAARVGTGPHDLAGTVTDASGHPVTGVMVTADLELGPGLALDPSEQGAA